MSNFAYLSSACYGKDAVRVFHVVREGPMHAVIEYNVKVLLEEDIELVSYMDADNRSSLLWTAVSKVSCKIPSSPHIMVPEWFAVHLATHIVSKYAHIHKAFVDIEQLCWSRIVVGKDRKPHRHSFFRDRDEKRIVKVEVRSQTPVDARSMHLIVTLPSDRCVMPHPKFLSP
ncbi:hypothetical protein GG344DRAFT_59379 [Lentinula edodes]|nr:hypothetical protein GG344DRAFT_59379 [Lentinula edodes]